MEEVGEGEGNAFGSVNTNFWRPLCHGGGRLRRHISAAVSRFLQVYPNSNSNFTSTPNGFMKHDTFTTTTAPTPASTPSNGHFTNSMHTPASSSATGDVPLCAFCSSFIPRFPSDYPSSTTARAPSNSTPSSSTGSKHAAAETEEARHDEGDACAACTASAGGSGSGTFAYLESLGAGSGVSEGAGCSSGSVDGHVDGDAPVGCGDREGSIRHH
ncbi:hypothetical protein B0H13DRAFT_2014934 [Mycena leptocephala]|nr:hypothetical protein B0H13DRAFT_2014934 [Mycena leptocephala]